MRWSMSGDDGGTRRPCPLCGAPDALLLFQQARCHNAECRWYDAALEGSCTSSVERFLAWIEERRRAGEERRP